MIKRIIRCLFLLQILFSANIVFSQIAVIKDKDGYTNVRKLPNSDSEIIYKLKSYEVFSYEVSESNWIPVYISKNKYQLQCNENQTLHGYIHKSRLNPIENLEVYTGEAILFEYKLKKFSSKNKVLDYDGKLLKKINGRKFYGTDGDTPKIEVSNISVLMNKKKIEILKILYEDIFECSNVFTINKNDNNFIIHQWNSDGAGGYLIAWVFGDGKLKQRYIFIP